jgi:hypothetical protein
MGSYSSPRSLPDVLESLKEQRRIGDSAKNATVNIDIAEQGAEEGESSDWGTALPGPDEVERNQATGSASLVSHLDRSSGDSNEPVFMAHSRTPSSTLRRSVVTRTPVLILTQQIPSSWLRCFSQLINLKIVSIETPSIASTTISPVSDY